MKTWKLPCLSRGWRIVCNLVFAALTAVFVWGLYNFPLPPRLDFRRMERENLLGRSEIQGVFRDRQDRWAVFGVQGDQVILYNVFWPKFWPRAEGSPVLIPLEDEGIMSDEVLFIAADVPEGTVSVRLDFSVDCWYAKLPEGGTSYSALEGGYPRDDSLSWEHWERECHTEGERLEDGGVLFRVVPEDADLPDNWVLLKTLSSWDTYRQSAQVRGLNCRMEAVFYGENGEELGRAVLRTEEEGAEYGS